MKPKPNARMQIVDVPTDDDLVRLYSLNANYQATPRYLAATAAPAGYEVPVYPEDPPEDVTGTGDLGALSLTATVTNIDTTGASTGTLGPGNKKGQIKKKRMTGDLGDAVITVSGDGVNSVTLDDVGDTCELQWNGTGWIVIDNVGCTIA